MAIYGQGITPPQGAIANELTAVTRRAYMHTVYVQLWKSAPLIAALLNSAQVASGGISPITVPLQGTPMVTISNIGYDGTFNQPGVTPGLQNAEWNLKGYITAIPFLGMEGLVQVDYSVVPLIEARLNDACNVTRDQLASDLYNNISNTQSLIGLNGAVDDGTYLSTYAGISRTSNTFWRSIVVANSPAVAPTQDLMYQYLLQVQKYAELPKMGIMGMGTFGKLAQDIQADVQYHVTPSSNFGMGTIGSYFRAIDIAGVPFYADPYCPEGTLYLLNTDYLSLFIHERAGFTFTGFESRLPVFQIGYIGAILTLLELVNVKCKSHAKVTGLTYLSI